MEDYLSAKKDITVITNNMALGEYLNQNGVKVIPTGGGYVCFLSNPYDAGEKKGVELCGHGS